MGTVQEFRDMTTGDSDIVPLRTEAAGVGFLISIPCREGDTFGRFHNAPRGLKKNITQIEGFGCADRSSFPQRIILDRKSKLGFYYKQRFNRPCYA